MNNYHAVIGYGREWDPFLSKRISRFIGGYKKNFEALEGEDLVITGGLLLKYGVVGDFIYDLIVDLTGTKLNLERGKELLKELTKTIKVYDYVITFRNMLTELSKRITYYALVRINSLVLLAYNHGRLEGVNSTTKEVFFSNSVDPSLLEVAIDLELIRRKLQLRSLKFLLPFASSDIKKFSKLILDTNGRNVKNYLSSLKTDDFKILAAYATITLTEAYTSSLYNEITESFNPDFDLLSMMPMLSIRAEQHRTKDTNFTLQHFKANTLAVLPNNILGLRDFTIDEKGIKVTLNNNTTVPISSFEVREVHIDNQFDEHYLLCYYTLRSGSTRIITLSMTNFSSVSSDTVYLTDVYVTYLLLQWLGLIKYTNANDTKATRKILERTLIIEDYERFFERYLEAHIDITEEAEIIMSPANFHCEVLNVKNNNRESVRV